MVGLMAETASFVNLLSTRHEKISLMIADASVEVVLVPSMLEIDSELESAGVLFLLTISSRERRLCTAACGAFAYVDAALRTTCGTD